MSLFHLYNTQQASIHREKLLTLFDKHTSLKIDECEIVSSEHKVYILELEEISKPLSKKIIELFEPLKYPLIYFLIPEKHSISLFQLAFLLNAKSIITSTQDSDKVMKKILKDYANHVEYYQGVLLGQNLINHQSYLLFEDSKLSYASEQLRRDFGLNDLEQIQNHLCSKLDIPELLSEKKPVKKLVLDTLVDDSTFLIKSITHSKETLISFEEQTEYVPTCNELSYISTRVSFIELLKDKLIEKMISGTNYTLLALQLQEVSKVCTQTEVETFRKEFLQEVQFILDSKIILAEYETDLYIAMFETITFEELQEKAKNFHLQISNFLSKQKSKHVISLYAINIDRADLNPLLNTIDMIANDKLDTRTLLNKNVKYINNFQDNMSEKEIINFMLENIFVNSSELKLLNIYKGMCISTSSKIFKKTEDVVYVTIEQVQGVVMGIEKRVVLQSPILSRSIRAQVKHINMKEKYAVLENFTILEYDPNARQHGRVNSEKVVPIAISLTGTRVKGELIDISANSIAIKAKKTRSFDNILNKEIGLTFYLDSARGEHGSYKMVERATVIHDSIDDKGYLKLVCIFVENRENEDVLIDYIFHRQKNIINKMRDMI